ncbi:hypothetical protein AB434_3499 [Heyndrickxia coagulans]|uniref:Uncharacterized protein n=1 Tax=Heyndrickxia coagulans TaxID=1398 RepID=A0AAN0T492_HEYCO|nr:hypothetical protein SB48_HM08orf02811 [Heyndrickxia coagulans]AKN55904.1 hypothetical protein AB434_3499 [Heyndrickxia coagulans]
MKRGKQAETVFASTRFFKIFLLKKTRHIFFCFSVFIYSQNGASVL